MRANPDGYTLALVSTSYSTNPSLYKLPYDAVKDNEAVTRYGILGPKGVPRNVVALWNREVARKLQTDEMKSRMTVEAIEPAGGPPEEFLNAIRSDVAKWAKVVKAAGITLGN